MRLITLGALRLSEGNFHRLKPLLVLCYLCLEGPQERRYLAELFWSASEHARRNLSTVLTRLRHLGPGIIESDEVNVWTTLACDAKDLRTALVKGRSAEVLKLYQGSFLKGVNLRLGSELEEWVYTTRESFADKVRKTLIDLAAADGKKGRFERALVWAERAYNLEDAALPSMLDSQRLYRLLLAGNSVYAETFHKEISDSNLQLPTTTKEAQEHLLASQVQDHQVPHNLPDRGLPFVGRESDISEITKLLEQDDCHMVTLLGVGGIGKTRLALEVAKQTLIYQPPKDGVFFVPLESIKSVDTIPSALANVFGIELAGQNPPQEQILRYLSKKHMVLLIDNFEHVIEANLFVAKLIEACPHLKVLVTSRQRLNIEKEWVFELEGLSYPSGSPTLERATYFDAIRLFVRRVKQVQNKYTLNQDQLEAIVKLCHLVGGMPLAIELAASWHKLYTTPDIVAELETSIDILETTHQDTPDRHSSMEAVFAHSWNLLAENEQIILVRLSVFSGGFTKEAALKVAGASLSSLTSLVDKSLIQSSPTGRFTIHPLLRQYAETKLVDKEVIQENHSRYFCDFFKSHEVGLQSMEARQHRAEVTLEIDNIRLAWRFAATHAREDLLNTAYLALTWYFLGKSQLQEPQELYDLAIDVFEKETIMYARMLREKAKFLCLSSRFAECITIMNKCLITFRKHQLIWDEANALFWVSISMRNSDQTQVDKDTHRATCKLAADRYYEAGDLREYAWVINGYAHFFKEPAIKESLYRESLTIFREKAPSFGITNTLTNLGLHLAQIKGDYQAALELVDEALAIDRDQGNEFRMTQNLRISGKVLMMVGDLEKAKQQFKEIISISRSLEPSFRLWRILPGYVSIAHVSFLERDFGQAKINYDEALSFANSHESSQSLVANQREIAKIYKGLACIFLDEQALDQALEYCQEALTRIEALTELESLEFATVQIESLNVLAQLRMVHHETTAARQCLSKAFSLAEEYSLLPHTLDLLMTLAELEMSRGNQEKAIELLQITQEHPASMFETRQRVFNRLSHPKMNSLKFTKQLRKPLEEIDLQTLLTTYVEPSESPEKKSP